jgi:hypothetical protein
MKNLILTFFFLSAFSIALNAQIILAKWTFPTGNSTDSLADGGIPVNLDKAIKTMGGTSAIDFSKNGATTKAAQATNWDNGSMFKYWTVMINTKGYENLKISSKMQSGGNNPGPRDFVVQYHTGIGGTWADIPGTTIVTANDWTTGWLDSVAMPTACNNQETLYLRWIMTSNLNSSGATVTATGINKIDDIYITGKMIETSTGEQAQGKSCLVYPFPADQQLIISSSFPINNLTLYSISGRIWYQNTTAGMKQMTISVETIPAGIYMLSISSNDGQMVTRKVAVAH